MKIGEMDEVRGREIIITLAPDETVRDAAGRMADGNIGAAPVVADDRIVGIFSERDLMKNVVVAGRDVTTTTIAEVMTSNPQTVRRGDEVSRGLDIMSKGGFRHLPVVDEDDKLVGFLSQRDFMAMTLPEMLKKTARRSFIDMAKAPSIAALVALVVVYFTVMTSIV